MNHYGLRAFSLIELMLALSLMGVLLLFAEAGFAGFISQAKTHAAVQRLYSDIRFAQSVAISKDQVVTLCGSDNGHDCDGAWSRGRLVLNQLTGQRLRYDRLSVQGGSWYWRSSFGRNHYLKFAPSGFTLGQQGRFYYCLKAHALVQKVVVVASSGRLRIEDNEKKLCASFY